MSLDRNISNLITDPILNGTVQGRYGHFPNAGMVSEDPRTASQGELTLAAFAAGPKETEVRGQEDTLSAAPI